MLTAVAQVVQDGARSQNVMGAYPPSRRTSDSNPQGHLHRISACVSNSTLARELVVTGVTGRLGATIVPAAAKRESSTINGHKKPHQSSDDGTDDYSDADVPTIETSPAAETREMASTATAAIGVGCATMKLIQVGGGGPSASNVVVSCFVRNRSIERPGSLGEVAGECTADIVSHMHCTSLTQLAWYLFRSCKDQSFTDVTNATLAASATWRAASSGAWTDGAEVPGDTLPGFLHDWTFPLSPLFVSCTRRLPRSSGATEAVAQAGRVCTKSAEQSTASVIDLSAVLDDRFGGAIIATLKKRPVPLAAMSPTSGTDNVHPHLRPSQNDDSYIATKRSRQQENLRRCAVEKHTLFTAVFTRSGLIQARGRFFSRLSHGERMIVATVALCFDYFGITMRDEAPRCIAREVAWSYTRRGKQLPITLLVARVSDGVSYIAGVTTGKEALPPTIVLSHLVARLSADARLNTGAVQRFIQTGGALGVAGCCTIGDKLLPYPDLSVLHASSPGLIEAHCDIIERAHHIDIVAQHMLGRGLAAELTTVEKESMSAGLLSLRHSVHSCPPLHVALSRQGNEHSIVPVAAVEKTTKHWRFANRDVEIGAQSEWATRPEQECAFSLSTSDVAAGSVHHHLPAATHSCLPSNPKTQIRRQRIDLSNTADALPYAAVCDVGANIQQGRHTFTTPTSVFVDEWPDDDGVSDEDLVTEAHINCHIKAHHGSSQSPLLWGHTTAASSVLHAATTEGGAAVSAKGWLKLVLAPNSILRSAVNMAYRPVSKGSRIEADGDDSSSSCENVHLSDYDDEDDAGPAA